MSPSGIIAPTPAFVSAACRGRLAVPWGLAATIACAVVLSASPAWANGAFPESEAILLPANRPEQIVLSTNFGLIISDDGGATWQWTCERPETSMGTLYTVGPPPDDRLFSLSPDVGLAVSTDGSCTWRRSGGALADRPAVDYFPDPTDATRVLALVGAGTDDSDGGPSASALYVSTNGGESFTATPLYTTTEATLVGLEIARSDPRIIYLAGYRPGLRPLLLRSTDGGAHFTVIDLEPMLGASMFRIVAVDPQNPDVVYLRVIAAGGDVLAVTHDGGATFTRPVTVVGGALTGFARLTSGTVLVTGLLGSATGATEGSAWRSSDGGVTFQSWTLSPQPHLRALAERDGKLFLAGKNYSDGWALAVSTDEGRTLQPIATYDQVSAIRPCAKEICMSSCDYQAGLKIWEPEVCTAAPGDGSTTGGGGGCGCAVGGPGAAVVPAIVPAVVPTILAALAALAAVLARRGRRARGKLRSRA